MRDTSAVHERHPPWYRARDTHHGTGLGTPTMGAGKVHLPWVQERYTHHGTGHTTHHGTGHTTHRGIPPTIPPWVYLPVYTAVLVTAAVVYVAG